MTPFETTPSGLTVIDREAGVLAYTYSFSKDGSSANMFVARLPGGKLMVVSPSYKTPDGVFDDLAEFGEVGVVVANNGFHHLGQPEYRERFPSARFFAPPKAPERIARKNADAGAFEALSDLDALLGDGIGVRAAASTKCGETWAWAKIAGGYAWYTSDVLHNMPSPPSNLIVRFLFWATGTSPGFGLFNTAMKFTLADKKGALGAMRDDMTAHAPTVIVPGHGPILSRDGLGAEAIALVESAA